MDKPVTTQTLPSFILIVFMKFQRGLYTWDCTIYLLNTQNIKNFTEISEIYINQLKISTNNINKKFNSANDDLCIHKNEHYYLYFMLIILWYLVAQQILKLRTRISGISARSFRKNAAVISTGFIAGKCTIISYGICI